MKTKAAVLWGQNEKWQVEVEENLKARNDAAAEAEQPTEVS